MSVKLDGKFASDKLYNAIKSKRKFNTEYKTLAIVTIGDDEASKVYVNKKKQKAVECGFHYQHIQLSANTNYFQLETIIRMLNENVDVKGIIIQKPLTDLLKNWEEQIDNLIDPEKDIDGFHPMSKFTPCTPKGIISLLETNKVPFARKNVVIAGRSDIVAKPLAKLFMECDCTVTMIHSKTDKETVQHLINNCDIFVSAIGKLYYWTEDYFKGLDKKTVLVDVGINRMYSEELNKYVVRGDVHPDCYKYFDYYTPVPGGVGLMTVATLIDNLALTK